MSICGSSSFRSIQDSESINWFGDSNDHAQYEELSAFLQFDITLKWLSIASTTKICNELPKKEFRVRFKEPNSRFSLSVSMRDASPFRCCSLYECEVIRFQWSVMNEVRTGHFFFYRDGRLCYEGFWENPSALLESTRKGAVMIELSLSSHHIIYRGGFHPTSYQRNGWGCEYSEATGKLKCCSRYENGELVKLEKVFDEGMMIEYAGKKSVKYIGEYKDDYGMHYPRHGYGVEVNPANGMEVWNGEWRDGRKWKAMQCDSKEWFVMNEENELSYGFRFTKAQNWQTMQCLHNPQSLQSLQSLQHITTLCFDDWSGCDEQVSTLDLSFYPLLKRIRFGKGCFQFVTSFFCCGMIQLKSIAIGDSCFHQSVHSCSFKENNYTCVIRDDPKLQLLTIGICSFSAYHHCLLESPPRFSLSPVDLPSLSILAIGECPSRSHNFAYAQSFVLRSLPRLEEVTLGAFSFRYTSFTVFEGMSACPSVTVDLPSLKRIVLGSFSLSGDPSIEDVLNRKGKPMCQLVMKDLPRLRLLQQQSIHLPNDASFLFYTHVIAESDIPILSPSGIQLQTGGQAFGNVRVMNTREAAALYQFIQCATKKQYV